MRLGPDCYQRIAQLCHDLDGVPLALEIVAAQVNMHSIAMIQTELAQLLPRLARPLRDGDPRHHSLWHTLDWSYRLLSSELQHVFQCLSVFECPWMIEAAAAIMGPEIEAAVLESHISLLVQKHLIRRTVEAGHTCFDMFYVVRKYAYAQLTAQGAVVAIQDRHAQYYGQLTTQYAVPQEPHCPVNW